MNIVLRQVFKVVGVSVVLMLVLIAGACTAPYKTYTLRHETQMSPGYQVRIKTHFSFEYPREYKRVYTHTSIGARAPIEVRFAAARSGPLRGNAVLGVHIQLSTPERRNAWRAANRVISGLGDDGLVHERSSTNISGVPAELIVYTDPRNPATPAINLIGKGNDPTTYSYSPTVRFASTKFGSNLRTCR